MPQYKDKLLGRNIVIYNIQAINKKYLKNNILLLSKTNIKISSKINFKNIRAKGMGTDHSWERACQEYIEIYNLIIEKNEI